MSRGPSKTRRQSPRDEERQRLEARWEKNRMRREAGRRAELVALSTTRTFDAAGNQVTMRRHGKRALAAQRAHDQYFAELRDRVRNWNRKPAKLGEASESSSDVKDAKYINGADVMEVLALASALTNHPAYDAARKAMRLHRLDGGGLRRAFHELQRRHGHNQILNLGSSDTVDGRPYDTVQRYKDEFGYKSDIQAIRHIVADTGTPGQSFANAVESARKAYARRERDEAERQQYLEELHGTK